MLSLPAGHKGDVYAVCALGLIVATGGHDKSICLWDAGASGKKLLRRLPSSHTHLVKSLAACSLGGRKLLVSGSWDMVVKVWDMDTGSLVHTLEGHTNRVKALAVAPPLAISGGDDGAIRMWNLETGQCTRFIDGAHGHFISSLCVFSSLLPLGGVLASASSDKTVKLWSLESGECLSMLDTADDVVSCLAHFDLPATVTQTSEEQSGAEHGGRLCCGMASGKIRVYCYSYSSPLADADACTDAIERPQLHLRLQHTLTGHRGRVTGLELSKSSSSAVLFSVSQDGFLRSWSLADGLPGHITTRVAVAGRGGGTTGQLQGQGGKAQQPVALEVFGICSVLPKSQSSPSPSQSRSSSPVLPAADDAPFASPSLLVSEDVFLSCSDGRVAVCEVATVNTMAGGRSSLVGGGEEGSGAATSTVQSPSVAVNVRSAAAAPTAAAIASEDSGKGSAEAPGALSVRPVKLPVLRPGLSPTAGGTRRVIAMAPGVAAAATVEETDDGGAECLPALGGVPLTSPVPDSTSSNALSLEATGTRKQTGGAGRSRIVSRAKNQPAAALRRTGSESDALPAYCVLARAEAGVVEEMAQAALLLQAALGSSSSSRIGGPNALLAKAMRRLR